MWTDLYLQFTELLVNFNEQGRLKTCGNRTDPVILVIGNVEEYKRSWTKIAWLHKKFAKINQRPYPERLSKYDWKKMDYTELCTIKTVSKKKPEVLSWCREKRWRTVINKWSKVIFSDESQLYVCKRTVSKCGKKSKGGWRPDLATRPNDR